jgi:hypothetical protein
MSCFCPGDTYCKMFTTQINGVPTDATSTPTAAAWRTPMGSLTTAVDSGFALTVAKAGSQAGLYKITGTIPTGYMGDDTVEVVVTAPMAGLSAPAVETVHCFKVDAGDPATDATAQAIKLATDKLRFDVASNVKSAAQNLPVDYQQRGVAVTLPAAPAGYGGSGSSTVTTDSLGRVTLAPAGLDAIVVETGVNARQALTPILAASAGVLSGAGTGSIVIKGGNVATTRIAATTDANGNRTSVTLTLPA